MTDDSAFAPDMAAQHGLVRPRLAGHVMLVTGGVRGIGEAIATAFAQEGAHVGILDLKRERVDAMVAQLRDRGAQASGYAGDAADRAVLAAACRDLVERYGRLDTIVSNAVWARYEPISSLTPDTVDRMLAIGVKAVVWAIQLADEIMGPVGRGSLINIGSIAESRSTPNALMYSGIKAAVGGLTRAAAVDLGPKGIRVNAIAPGTTMTDGVARNVTGEALEQRLARTPLGRLGKVDDIAQAAVFLASDESSWITGSTLVVDGGITAGHL